MNRPLHFRWLLASVPVVLIGLAFGLIHWLRREPAETLRDDTTYEVWLSEAEVTPTKRDGDPWDADGSAPDLKGVIVWQNQRVLETVAADNGLVAQWEPVAVKLTQVLQGEADAASVRRVARVRPEAAGALEVGVFDDDPARSDLAGAFRVPWSVLRPGVNEIQTAGMVRRLRIVVIEPGGEMAKLPFHQVTGAVELAAAPAAMGGMLGGLTREAKDAAAKAAGALGTQADDLGRKAGGAAGAVKKWLQPGTTP
jgi:hypothetical protein